MKRESFPSATSPKVKIVHRQIIDESHPAVQQLVDEYEYDLEASIEAVLLCEGDVTKAMNYLEWNEFGPFLDCEDVENKWCIIIIFKHSFSTLFFFVVVFVTL